MKRQAGEYGLQKRSRGAGSKFYWCGVPNHKQNVRIKIHCLRVLDCCKSNLLEETTPKKIGAFGVGKSMAVLRNKMFDFISALLVKTLPQHCSISILFLPHRAPLPGSQTPETLYILSQKLILP